jgi:hypothetical protein
MINAITNLYVQEEELEQTVCSLEKVRLIDFEKFAYGPPGLDIGKK